MAGFQDKIMVVIDATSGAAVKEMDRLQKSTKDADLGVAALGKTLKTGLVAGAAAFAGAGLVSFLNDSVTSFAEAQKAATLFSTAMNTSGENAGKLATYLNMLGVDTNDLIEINAEFGRAIKTNGAALDQLGVSLKKNADGSVDTADAFVQVIDGLQGIEDGTKRSQLALKFFGEEGTKQLAPLIFGTKNLKDTLADLEFVYDPKRAQEYAAAQQELDLAFQALQQTLGQALIPAFTEAARVAKDIIDVLADIPVEVYAIVGGAVALKAAMNFFGPALSQAVSNVALAMTGLGAATEAAGGKAALVGKGFSGLVSAIGPANIALAAVAAGLIAVAVAQKDFEDAIASSLPLLDKFERKGFTLAKSLDLTAQSLEQSRNPLQDFFAAFTDGNGFKGFLQGLAGGIPNVLKSWGDAFRTGGDDVDAYRKQVDEARKAAREAAKQQGAYAEAVLDAQESQEAFNKSVAEFAKTGSASAYKNLIADAQKYAASLREQERLQRLTQEALASVDLTARIKLRVSDTELQLEAYDLIDKVKAAVEEQGKITPATPQVEVDRINLNAQLAVDNLTLNWQEQVKRGLISQEQFEINLQTLKILYPSLGPQIDTVIQEVRTSLGTTPVDADITVNPKIKILEGQIKAEMESAVKNPRVIEELSSQLNAELKTTNTVTTTFAPDGYEAVKARTDYLAQTRAGTINIAHTFNPDGYNALKARSDYLAQNRTATIDVKQTFSGGPTYDDYKRRIDYLSTNRSATVTITVKLAGTAAAIAAAEEAAGQSIGVGEGAAVASRRSANMMFSPINMVRVSLDGRELRSVIDDEIRALTPTTQEVA